MEQYHGTNSLYAASIVVGQVNVNLGGGELGKGFYTGDLLHKACDWAWHQYQTDKAVVGFTLNDDDFLNLDPHCPNYSTTERYRMFIKSRAETRTYLFNENALWAPVVGRNFQDFNQIKYETKTAENLLNGQRVTKIRIL